MSSRKPLQNRVLPTGEIIAMKSRGLLMGNRGGRLHDDTRTLGRARWRSRQWISCLLCFKDRRRPVMGPGYTELFFLDEATALAAGHRPCFECRRTDANRFAALWAKAAGLPVPPRAPEMDLVLHPERLGPRRMAIPADLPDGAMILCENNPMLLLKGSLWRWTPEGYANPHAPPPDRQFVLTPPAICAVLAAGYHPLPHPSCA